MLTGPQFKFCQLYAVSQNGKQAYLEAYPNSSPAAAETSAYALLRKPQVIEEIDRIRKEAREKGAVLTLAEKRAFIARLVKVNAAELDLKKDGDLLAGIDRVDGSQGEVGVLKLKLSDKLRAIQIDNDLAHEGAQAEGLDAMGQLLERLRK